MCMRRVSRILLWLGGMLLLGASGLAAAQNRVVYVDLAATGAKDGSSWADAFTDLHAGLAAITLPHQQVWVAQGIYRTSATDDPYESFKVFRPMKVFGGFAGNETTLSQRDPEQFPTILSGAIGSPSDADDAIWIMRVSNYGAGHTQVDGFRFEDTAPNPNAAGIHLISGQILLGRCSFVRHRGSQYGAVHVAHGGYLEPDSFIEDCRFEDNGPGPVILAERQIKLRDCHFQGNQGVGVLHLAAGGSVRGCRFENNVASFSGGITIFGKDIMYWTPPEYNIIDCEFIGNRSALGGGGVYMSHSLWMWIGRVRILGCIFEDNWSGRNGGAISTNYTTPRRYPHPAAVQVDRCRFGRNFAVGTALGAGVDGGGGAIFGQVETITNCLFWDNEAASGHGGAVCIPNDQAYWHTQMANCTVVGNRAFGSGGGVFAGRFSHLEFVNGIAWGNESGLEGTGEKAQLFDGYATRMTVLYSSIQNLRHFHGTGNVSTRPDFVDPLNGDFRLQPLSPLIDAGSPATATFLDRFLVDLGGGPRVQGASVDLGCFEIR